ncbi:MAG TPA: hypothetical protein VGI60_07205 [Chthoniobacterales bacterium]
MSSGSGWLAITPGRIFASWVINRILRGDKIDVGFKSSTGGSAGANVIQPPGTNSTLP